MNNKSQYKKEIEEYISKKIDGHGGCSTVSFDGLYQIDSIFGGKNKSKLKIFFFNIILFIKYIKAKIKGDVKARIWKNNTRNNTSFKN